MIYIFLWNIYEKNIYFNNAFDLAALLMYIKLYFLMKGNFYSNFSFNKF